MSGYRKTWTGRWLWFALVALIIAIRLWSEQNQPQPPEALAEGIHHVRRVVDGDTLLLESGARIRLQGIDTPETVRENTPVEPWGPEASSFAKRFVKDAGGKVHLTFSNERVDHYGRFLAFVWHGERMLNEELVQEGLAHARMDYRYGMPMKRRLRAAQEEAQAAQRGIWSTGKNE